MKEHEYRDTIEGLLADEAARHSPIESEVLGLVRRVHSRRRMRRGVLGLSVAVACAGLLVFIHGRNEPIPVRIAAAPPAPVEESEVAKPFEGLRHFTDGEALDYLGDAPVAMVTRSDGSRALIMLVRDPLPGAPVVRYH